MRINISKLKSRNLPWGFFIFLLLAGTFEITLQCIPERSLLTVPYGQEAMRIKGEEAEKTGGYDILITGDCTGWAGIRPALLEARLGKSAYNFSVDVDQTYLINYILLKRYLNGGARKPELVILQLSPISLLGNHFMDLERLRNYVFPYFRADRDLLAEIGLLKLAPPFRYLPFRLLSLLPSFRKQYALRKGLPDIIARARRFRENEYAGYLKKYRRGKGYFNEDLDPTKEKVEVITDIPPEYKRFQVSSYNCYYIDRILSLLHENGIPAVVCLSPVRSDEMEIWKRFDLHDRLLGFLRPKMKEYDNVAAFWDLSGVASDPKYFADRVHLTFDGASVFTEELAERIRDTEVLE